MLNVPRMAREVASFAQDVRWLVDMARDACRPPKKSEPEWTWRGISAYSPEKSRSLGLVSMRPGIQLGRSCGRATTLSIQTPGASCRAR